MGNPIKNRINGLKRRALKKPLSPKIIAAEAKLKGCGTKRFFASEDAAERICKGRANAKWGIVEPYKCMFCTGWHVTQGKGR
jgi:hypothetical protein